MESVPSGAIFRTRPARISTQYTLPSGSHTGPSGNAKPAAITVSLIRASVPGGRSKISGRLSLFLFQQLASNLVNNLVGQHADFIL